MKKFFLPLMPLVIFGACSVLEPSKQLEELRAKDELILNGLEDGPLRQGTMKKETEGRITTEIWTWHEDHGSALAKTETLIFKDGKLVSQTLKDPGAGVTYSRQFRDGKVFQTSEEKKDAVEIVYLNDDKISGRIFYGKRPACFLYDKGADPRPEPMEVCERKFNTAP